MVMVYNRLLYETMDSKNSNHYAIIKDVVSSMKNGKSFNLPRLLEILNSSTDVDVQVKLFSALSAYLMLNDDNIAAIITYNPIYDKICKILANCPPRKTAVAFNFLSALLYVDEEDSHRKNSLISYARNMIRSSGCLATMCELFTTCMMDEHLWVQIFTNSQHQDSWRALCRCLAESCRGVEANQSYCTHLVPMCIQKCSQRNIEVFLVLQSLLQQHSRNITLFVECNGMELFQREFLQHDICLQLLVTIVQSSTEAAAVIANTDTCRHLRDFLQTYGPQSQLGQWATIVLYHTSRTEGNNHLILSNNAARFASCENPKVEEVQRKNNKLSESLLAKLHPADQNRQKECSADTTKLFQDVMKEILQCGAQKELNNLKTFFPPEIITNRNQKNTINYTSRIPLNDISQRKTFRMAPQDLYKFNARSDKVTTIQNESVQHNKPNELSFSFLRMQNSDRKQIAKNFVTADELPDSFQRTFQTNENRVRKNTVYESLMEIDESRLNTLTTDDFNPQFASTPKRNDMKYEYSRYENQRSTNYSVRSIQKSVRNQKKRRHVEKKKLSKRLERSKIDKEIKHKSFSGRFFDAINTSCTALVKTVKNIFRPKSDLHETENNTENDSLDKIPNQDTVTCSYSFTNYMRRRDAALKNECANKSGEGQVFRKSKQDVEDFSMEMSNSCNTCNNTIALKRKLVSDEHLKQTIRKLKLGINLYGCNFKKIARTMWPNENYMTPAIVYNLYRKLIVK